MARKCICSPGLVLYMRIRHGSAHSEGWGCCGRVCACPRSGAVHGPGRPYAAEDVEQAVLGLGPWTGAGAPLPFHRAEMAQRLQAPPCDDAQSCGAQPLAPLLSSDLWTELWHGSRGLCFSCKMRCTQVGAEPTVRTAQGCQWTHFAARRFAEGSKAGSQDARPPDANIVDVLQVWGRGQSLLMS